MPAIGPNPLIDALLQTADPDTELHHPEEALFKPGTTATIVDGLVFDH